MKRSLTRACTLLTLAVGWAFSRAEATTVAPPAFDSLVSQSDYVVRAVVRSVDSEWQINGANRSIVTKVELTVREVIKGKPPAPLVLEMLGGTIGDTSMVVDGTPKFKVGDEDILFIHGNGRQFSPLVGLGYGRYPIARDSVSGDEIVLRANGHPLYDTNDVAQAMSPTAVQTSARPLSAVEFISKIRASLSQHPSPTPANAN